MAKHMASKTKWPVSLWCFFFSFTNNVTNVLWHDGRFMAKAQMRTKSCGTISTLSSCSIDLHVGHGPPLLSPITLPLSPQDCVCHLISPSSQSGLNKSITSFFAAWLYCRPQPFWGKSLCFSQITLLGVSLVQSYGSLSKLTKKKKKGYIPKIYLNSFFLVPILKTFEKFNPFLSNPETLCLPINKEMDKCSVEPPRVLQSSLKKKK